MSIGTVDLKMAASMALNAPPADALASAPKEPPLLWSCNKSLAIWFTEPEEAPPAPPLLDENDEKPAPAPPPDENDEKPAPEPPPDENDTDSNPPEDNPAEPEENPKSAAPPTDPDDENDDSWYE